MDKQLAMELGWDDLKEQSLLHGLTEEQIRYLFERSKQEKFLPNEIILEEGEQSTDVYLIIEGEANVLKWDENHLAQVVVGRLVKGDTFGEMSFMDNSPRSTTIKAAKPATLLKITKENLISAGDILKQIYANIAIVNINRLRTSNSAFVKNLQTSQQLFQIREHVGQFLLFLYLIVGIISLLMSRFFPSMLQTYLLWIVVAVPAIFMIRAKRFEFAHFGVNLQKWPSVLLTSSIALILVLGCIYFMNAYLNVLHISAISLEAISTRLQSPMAWPLYALFALSQEFVMRGVLQTALQDFLQDEKGLKAWIINALFLFVLTLPLGIQPAIQLFLIGLPMGLLYLKQRSLLGVSIIHFLLIILGLFLPK